jgi:hypothetical protein
MGIFFNKTNIMAIKLMRIILLVVAIFSFSGCYSYIGSEIPNRLNTTLPVNGKNNISYTIICNDESEVAYYSDQVNKSL